MGDAEADETGPEFSVLGRVLDVEEHGDHFHFSLDERESVEI